MILCINWRDGNQTQELIKLDSMVYRWVYPGFIESATLIQIPNNEDILIKNLAMDLMTEVSLTRLHGDFYGYIPSNNWILQMKNSVDTSLILFVVPSGAKAKIETKSCECGAEKVGSFEHSSWCPKHL